MSIDVIVDDIDRSGVAVDSLIVDDLFKKKIVEFYSRRDFHNPQYWADKKTLMKEYRRQCAEHLIKEYKWPKGVAKKVSSGVNIPKNRFAFTDVLAGYFIGNLPERYVDPVAKLMGTKRSIYTWINIAADVAFLGVAGYLIENIRPEDVGFVDNMFNLTNQSVYGFLLKANFLTRLAQIPVRTLYQCRGKHTWSPATLVNPNIIESIIIAPLIVYDYYHKFKDSKKKKEYTKSSC